MTFYRILSESKKRIFLMNICVRKKLINIYKWKYKKEQYLPYHKRL